METLWNICGWTGFAWWCGVIFAGTISTCAAVVEALCARWEEAELRRIAAWNDDDLPANWGELDGERSFRVAWDEIRYERDWRP